MRDLRPRLPRARALLSAAVAALLLAAPALAAKPKARNRAKVPDRRTVARAAEAFGGSLTVVAEGADTAHVARAIARAFAAIADLERAIGAADSSELAVVNQGPAQTRLRLSPGLCGALDRALELAQETAGAYDPTVEPLNRIHAGTTSAAPATVTAARLRVGWRRARLDRADCTLWLQADSMALDLSRLAPGLALERAERELRAAGVERALLRLGADGLAMSDAAAWLARVPHPATRGLPGVDLALRTAGVATASSGATGEDGTKPVMDPARGEPVRGVASVTVVTRTPTRAAALAAAFLVMGRDAVELWAREHDDAGILWLEPDPGGGDGIRAWRWHLPSAAPAAGAEVDWRN